MKIAEKNKINNNKIMNVDKKRTRVVYLEDKEDLGKEANVVSSMFIDHELLAVVPVGSQTILYFAPRDEE